MITTVTLNAAIDKFYHVNRFGLNQVNRVIEMIEVPGGKGINVAKVAHTLGSRVVASGFIGGTNGQFIQQSLEQIGIQCDFVWVSGNSRQNLAILDKEEGTQTEILEPGPVIDEKGHREIEEKIRALSQKSKVVSFSGSIPQGLTQDIYGKLIRIAKREGALTILDSSGVLLSLGLEGKPDICKPNRDELEQILGYRPNSGHEIIEASRKLIEKGIQLVVVSMDKEGSIAVAKDAAWQIKPPVIKVESTVGCGDSLVAGIAYYFDRLGAIQSREGIETAIRWGTAAAASNALDRAVGSVRLEEVELFLNIVSIERF